ncbi:PREDICTED: pyroglutamyl-peptidase 1 [Polistes dominula]|uniref:Pyroglutamyl-peptidase 1 n=1 Tax=Polistes dominula TaxID=743375 RepID=A0ABM1ITG2_POLDO|nr:PREDICTED: pyroglutamyl-peptidase 1 [Polistes dominula]
MREDQTNVNGNTILITGFGPFDKHVVNASWEAVKELSKLWPQTELCNIQLITKQIPVSYQYVSTEISKLWEEYDPIIVIHVGVSYKASCLTIEHIAHNTGYVRPDIDGKCPYESQDICHALKTNINVKNLCDSINENSKESGCTACISHDAGRYLCEYIFYQSLNIKTHKTLFIHVPDLNVYSSLQTAKGLYDIICFLVKNLNDD